MGNFRFGLVFLLCCFPAWGWGQVAENISFKANEVQKTVAISYDLLGEDPTVTCAVRLYCVDVKDSTLYGPLESITGVNSFGKQVTLGAGKLVIWEVLKDIPQGLLTKVEFRVEVVPNVKREKPTVWVEDVNKPWIDGFTEKATGVEFEMIFVKGGLFEMGARGDVVGDKLPHQVEVSDFWAAETEVTVAQFAAFVDDTRYETDAEKHGDSWIYLDGDWKTQKGVTWRDGIDGERLLEGVEYDHPVIHVSWHDAQAYCKWLSVKTKKKYSLPTEAQWEFIAGGGAEERTQFAGTDGRLEDYGWFYLNARRESWLLPHAEVPGAQRVGTRKPNRLGFRDMSGNVWEWCLDVYGKDFYRLGEIRRDPVNLTKGHFRVLRGGSWRNLASECTVTNRDWSLPNLRSYSVGFRVVRNMK